MKKSANPKLPKDPKTEPKLSEHKISELDERTADLQRLQALGTQIGTVKHAIVRKRRIHHQIGGVAGGWGGNATKILG